MNFMTLKTKTKNLCRFKKKKKSCKLIFTTLILEFFLAGFCVAKTVEKLKINMFFFLVKEHTLQTGLIKGGLFFIVDFQKNKDTKIESNPV